MQKDGLGHSQKQKFVLRRHCITACYHCIVSVPSGLYDMSSARHIWETIEYLSIEVLQAFRLMDAVEENSEARAPIFFLAPWLCCEKHSPVTLYPPW